MSKQNLGSWEICTHIQLYADGGVVVESPRPEEPAIAIMDSSAYLSTAAPEMLDLLKRYFEECESCRSSGSNGSDVLDEFCDRCLLAVEVIEKAEGRS